MLFDGHKYMDIEWYNHDYLVKHHGKCRMISPKEIMKDMLKEKARLDRFMGNLEEELKDKNDRSVLDD